VFYSDFADEIHDVASESRVGSTAAPLLSHRQNIGHAQSFKLMNKIIKQFDAKQLSWRRPLGDRMAEREVGGPRERGARDLRNEARRADGV
jgi:hypothetical protein